MPLSGLVLTGHPAVAILRHQLGWLQLDRGSALLLYLSFLSNNDGGAGLVLRLLLLNNLALAGGQLILEDSVRVELC